MKNSEKEVLSEKKAERTAGRNKFSIAINKLLNGEFLAREGLVKHFNFIAFLVGLLILHISLIYYYENTERQIGRIRKDMDEEKSEYSSIIGKYEAERRQSKVAAKVAELGLHELITEPKIIEVEPGYLEEE
ncbi:MAG: FtsL-like putative cell division protein [Flavobacteriales bacterium]|nr:FtsL-like putative cell division protein [Flavobacteriales bacterium]